MTIWDFFKEVDKAFFWKWTFIDKKRSNKVKNLHSLFYSGFLLWYPRKELSAYFRMVLRSLDKALPSSLFWTTFCHSASSLFLASK